MCVAFTAVTKLLFATVSASNLLTSNWQKLPGVLTRISKGDSGIWGVNRDEEIYKKDSSTWTKVGGRLVQIST